MYLRYSVAFFCLTAIFGAPRPTALVDLANRARGTAPEFAADALLRIAESPDVTDAVWKMELIEDAFHMAGAAQQPYARRAWAPAHAGDTDKPYAQGLDALTLESRAVQAMLPLDHKKARELFAQIPAPRIPKVSCADPLVYDVSIFYATLGAVAAQAFTPKEIADEEPVHLLQTFVTGMNSPVEAGPVARMLSSASLKPPQLETLVDALAGALKQISGDDRTFSSTIAVPADALAIAELAATCTRQKISAAPLLDGWRTYLVRHLSAARCADTPKNETATGGLGGTYTDPDADYSGSEGAVRYFNNKMRTGDVRAISDDETKASKEEGTARNVRTCELDKCQELNGLFSHLVISPQGAGLSEEQRSGSEWSAKLKEYLDALAAWHADSDADEAFHWKGRFYSQLFTVAPNGPDREVVLTSMLSWLQQSSYQHNHRVEWFYPVNVLMIRAFGDPLNMKTAIRELRTSADPVVSVYAQLEQVLPRPLGSVATLLQDH